MPLWWLFLLALHLSAGVHLTGAAVSDSFRECSQFFYMGTVPTGIRGGSLKRICQRYGNTPRYATLYDASRRLAVFSAYTFKKTDGRSRMDTPWMYEPQVSENLERPEVFGHNLIRIKRGPSNLGAFTLLSVSSGSFKYCCLCPIGQRVQRAILLACSYIAC